VVNHLGQPLNECIALLFDLLAQAIVGDEVDIHQSVLLGDGDIAPVGDEVYGLVTPNSIGEIKVLVTMVSQAKEFGTTEEEACTFNGHGEIQRQIPV